MTFVRHLVAERLRDKLAALSSLDGVAVVREPRDVEEREQILIGRSEGNWRIKSFKPGSWEDRWTVRVEVSTFVPGSTLDVAEARLMELVGLIVDALIADPGLTSPTAITDLIGLDGGGEAGEEFFGPNSGQLPSGEPGIGSSGYLLIPFRARHC